MNPIWKDYIVTLGTQDSYSFRIRLHSDSTLIYTGKAYKRPGEANTTIRINDICADYLSNTLPALNAEAFVANDNIVVSFDVYILDTATSTYTLLGTYPFMLDWSYNYSKLYTGNIFDLSDPITLKVDARQIIPFTFVGMIVDPAAIVHFKNGTTTTVTFTRPAGKNIGTCIYRGAAHNDVDYVELGGKSYKVVTDCAKYALYYVNACGGWDSMLIEGNVQETDSLTRYTREGDYVNTDAQNRSKFNYVNDVAKSYTINTGLLTDAESVKMHHLINSTDVYLYDFSVAKMLPVVVATDTIEHRTFRSNGRQLIHYTFDVTLAQKRNRR